MSKCKHTYKTVLDISDSIILKPFISEDGTIPEPTVTRYIRDRRGYVPAKSYSQCIKCKLKRRDIEDMEERRAHKKRQLEIKFINFLIIICLFCMFLSFLLNKE